MRILNFWKIPIRIYSLISFAGLFAFVDGFANNALCSLTCPNNIITENDPGICGAYVDYTIELGDCSSYTMSPDLPSGSLFPLGTTILTATSDEGTTCSFYVFVHDTEVPTAICKNSLIVEIVPPFWMGVIAVELDNGSFDNCGAVAHYSFSPDIADTSVYYTCDCDDLGQHFVKLWVTDIYGNQDFCETSILVQDNYSFCDASGISFGGLIATEEGEGLEGVQVDWDWGIGFSFPQFTDVTGIYYFSCLTESPPYTFTPHLNTLPANGVTTVDLLLITRHILSLQLLDSPYKMIAADADRSGSITTLDLVAIRKVILVLEPGFPNNTSWRFVDKDYVFPEPMNPFSEPFPEAIEVINPYNGGLDKDFVAVKVGDVNGSAAVN